MRTRTTLLALSLVGLTFGAFAEPSRYGEAVKITEVTAIADLLADPAAFADREVRIEGQVSGVCKRMGCWIELADPEDRRLRVKVDDGVIVFPADAPGMWAAAQGLVTVRELSRDDYVAFQKHLVEENGGTFDAASVGEGPFQMVQIAGKGAELEDR